MASSRCHERVSRRARLRAVLGLVAIALTLPAGTPAANAATISVTTTAADELNADADCSLREAIQAANTDAAVDACPAGSGSDAEVSEKARQELAARPPEEALLVSGLDPYHSHRAGCRLLVGESRPVAGPEASALMSCSLCSRAGREGLGQLRERLEELRPPALPAKGEVTVELDEKTLALDFPTGKSPVALLRLPDWSQPYRLTVKSHIHGFGFTHRLFIPTLLLLDADLQVIRTVPEGQFRMRSGFTKRLEGSILVGEGNQREAYLLIFTDARGVGVKGASQAGAPVTIAQAGPVSFGIGIGPKVKRSTTAKLKVAASPLKESAKEAAGGAGDSKALFDAIERGALADVHKILSEDPFLLEAMESTAGARPLYRAAARDRRDIVAFLLADGADPAATNRDGETPYRAAERAGHVLVAELLKQ